MEQFNEKKYWTWKKILVVLGIILILAMVRVFTGDYFGNRQSKNLPKLIAENEVREAFSSMEENDINLMRELTQKAINLLPENEKQQLITLQNRFNKDGYTALTEDEISTMQELNKKALSLLPAEDKEKLNEIFEKTVNAVLEDTLKALVNNLGHSDEAVRWQAIVELEKLGPKAKGAVHDIIPYLERKDWRIRYYVAEILGTIGPSAKPAIPALQKALNDPDEKVRLRASWALDEISRDNQRSNNGR